VFSMSKLDSSTLSTSLSHTGSSTPSLISEDDFLRRDDSMKPMEDTPNIEEGEESTKKPPKKTEELEEPLLTHEEIEKLKEQDFTISLTETETIFFFERQDDSVPSDAPYLNDVKESNKRYKEVKVLLIVFNR
jgi:hypothetical protein